MRSEEDVPLEERYLLIEGHLSAKTRQTVRKGLRRELASSGRVCFVSSAYADLPIPREFECVFPVGRAEPSPRGSGAAVGRFQAKHLMAAEFVRVSIVEAMDISYKPLSPIPDGAKAICVLEFPDGVPFMIDDLPTVKDWDESAECVVLCSRETAQAIKRISGPRR